MIEKVRKDLKKNSSKAAADSIRKFVPGAQEVYGVKMPVLNLLARKYEEGGFDLVEELWEAGSFEERMLAARLLSRIAKKDPAQSFKLVERFSSSLSDWAICDCIGMQALRKLRKTHENETFALSANLIKSDDPWKRRLALVLIECYARDGSRRPQILKLVNKVRDDKEYYVKKAVVWLDSSLEKGR